MLSTFTLVRGHLQHAAIALDGTDSRSLQLRQIIERTVNLIEGFADEAPGSSNVLDFAQFRNRLGRSN